MNNVLSGTFRVYGGGRDAALRFASLKKPHTILFFIFIFTSVLLTLPMLICSGASFLAEVTLCQILSGRRLETLAMAMTGPHLFHFIKWPSIGLGNG